MQDAEKRSLFWPEDDCEFCPGKLFCLNFIQTIGGLPVRLVLRICLDKEEPRVSQFIPMLQLFLMISSKDIIVSCCGMFRRGDWLTEMSCV